MFERYKRSLQLKFWSGPFRVLTNAPWKVKLLHLFQLLSSKFTIPLTFLKFYIQIKGKNFRELFLEFRRVVQQYTNFRVMAWWSGLTAFFYCYMETKDNWEKFLPLVLHAYRTAVHSSTRVSPFQIMFGRSPAVTPFSVPQQIWHHYLCKSLRRGRV